MKLNLKQSGSWIGMAGLAVVLFMYSASGLLAPLWAVVALLLVWLVLFVVACRWFMRYPLRVLVLPLIAAGIWFAAMFGGGAFLGWTA